MITLKSLPRIPKLLVQHHNAWIVGGSADPDVIIASIKDIDIIVPFSSWNAATGLIPQNATKNDMGGWKFKSGKIVVDVWPEDLAILMLNDKVKFLWQPKYNIRFMRD